MSFVLEHGRRLLARWRRPQLTVGVEPYLNASLAAAPFTQANVAHAPATTGIYLLYRSGRLIFVGIAAGGAGIRDELEHHRRGERGPCTQAATAFDYEVNAYPAQAHREYLRAHMARYGGRLPPCNARAQGGTNRAKA